MNGTAVLREHDPKYLKRRRWERRGVILVAILAVVAVGAAGFAVASAFKTEKQITRIQQLVETPCLEYGSHSDQCEEAFEAAIATINHREACFVGQKMGIHPASCEGSHLRTKIPPRPKPSSSAGGGPLAERNGGDATSIPTTGHSQPAPGNGGSTGKSSHPHAPSVPHQPGGGAESVLAPAPAAPTAPSPSQPSSSSTTERTTETVVVEPTPEPEAPVRTAAGGLVEGVGHVVEETGGTVNGAVEGVTGTTCTLAKLLCP